jgi:Spy/CpxP family protein refolding chaperone
VPFGGRTVDFEVVLIPEQQKWLDENVFRGGLALVPASAVESMKAAFAHQPHKE